MTETDREIAARVIARLVFLGDEEPKPYRLPNVDQAIADCKEILDVVMEGDVKQWLS